MLPSPPSFEPTPQRIRADVIKRVSARMGVRVRAEVGVSLARAVEARLHEVLCVADRVRRHSRHSVLEGEHIQTALRQLGLPVVLGHRRKNDVVSLAEHAHKVSQRLRAPAAHSFTAHWVAVDGQQVDNPLNVSSLTRCSHDGTPLSQEQRQLLRLLQDSLLGNDAAMRVAALEALREGTGVTHLAPTLVPWLARGMFAALNTDLSRLHKLVTATRYLLACATLPVRAVAHQLLAPLLSAVICDTLGDGENEAHFTVRMDAAETLMALQHRLQNAQLQQQLLRQYLECLHSYTGPDAVVHDQRGALAALFGCIVGLAAMGEAAERALQHATFLAMRFVQTITTQREVDQAVLSHCIRVEEAIRDCSQRSFQRRAREYRVPLVAPPPPPPVTRLHQRGRKLLRPPRRRHARKLHKVGRPVPREELRREAAEFASAANEFAAAQLPFSLPQDSPLHLAFL